ncbi:unnamed protein product, partial [Dovyalis caffra]
MGEWVRGLACGGLEWMRKVSLLRGRVRLRKRAGGYEGGKHVEGFESASRSSEEGSRTAMVGRGGGLGNGYFGVATARKRVEGWLVMKMEM